MSLSTGTIGTGITDTLNNILSGLKPPEVKTEVGLSGNTQIYIIGVILLVGFLILKK